ncbi:MAG: laccase domain-containing protein [Phycisphaerales bacterium]|nr:laccase domain-containing protein [Phycisphaerales bacterium]
MLEFFQMGERRYARLPALARQGKLIHAFSTRPLDVSAREDARAPERAANRAIMARDLCGNPHSRVHHCQQVHKPRLEQVRDNEPPAAHRDCDGLWTTGRGVSLLVLSADCPLVLVYDPKRGAVGVCHSSWRCTVANLTSLLVQTLVREAGCDPRDLLAGIGPSAGPCCYEVMEDVRIAADVLPDADTLFPRAGDRMFFDLWAANAAQLRRAGIPDEQIEIGGVCTICSGDVFYSFRREGAGCGHFGLLAALA